MLPLMPGGDVGTLLEAADDHRLPLEQAIDLAMQVCRGLEFAHSKGIVHRDLKPGNIWLTADGTARIGDFGLAVAIDRSRLTQEGMMVGTVSYMPPEQAMGGAVSPQSDLYSLGAMLYEMVTGRPPFLGDDSVAIIGQHINTPPVAPTWHNSECPRALEALIMRLLAKDPGERPGSATDAITALEGVDLAVAAEEETPARDEAHALDSLAGGVFVGRHREMGELKAALEGALSGRGRLVTLVGEPGIGKTRTSEELATYARMRGAQVLWGRCHESRGAPPYWPWVQALRAYVRDTEPEKVRLEMGAGAADIAEIVSDVKERIPDLPASPRVEDPEQARFRLFDSITAFLKTASRDQPLAIILDNLHWADKPSLLLLEFLAQEFADSRLLVIGTYRDVDLSRQHPLSETLGELTRERLFQRVLLRGLSQDDVGRFIEITSGMTLRGLAEAVHTQTEGNPLFVTEVVRLLVQEGQLRHEQVGERDSWEMRIPEGVREVIGRRLNRLSARCNETLTTASVIGREFELRQLVHLVEGLSEDRLQEVLEEALSARVIEELPHPIGRYQFTHALVRQTLNDELTTTRRVRLHGHIADALEELYGGEAETHALELAYHYEEAESVGNTEKLIRYSRVAGEQALANYASVEALSHFERALAAKDGLAEDAETAEILYGLARAQAAALDREDLEVAVSTLGKVVNYYVEVGDAERAVAAAAIHIEPVEGLTTVSTVMAQALQFAAPESLPTGHLLARYGLALGVEQADYENARKALDRAASIARHNGDKALEMRAASSSGNLATRFIQTEEALEHSLRAVELAHEVDDPVAEAEARQYASINLLLAGDLAGARLHATALLELSEKFRIRYYQTMANTIAGSVATSEGDWQSVLGISDRGLILSPRNPNLLALRIALEYQLGNVERGSIYLDTLVESMGLTPAGPSWEYARCAEVISLTAMISGETDRLDVGREAARVVLSSPRVTPARAYVARGALALLAVQSQDEEAAREQYNYMESLKVVHGAGFTGTVRPRLLGLLARTMGNLDDAQTHFEDAITFCGEAGYRPELAWTSCDYADMLLERNDDGDRASATALLDESLAISSELGMRPLVERVLSGKMSLQGIDVSSPQTSIEAVVSAVEVERPNLQPHAAPDGTVTVMFTDIEGSTAMTERLGDHKAQDVLHIHNAIIREQVAAHQGFEVKSQGDGFMLAFSSARRALECAVAIQQTLTTHNAENPDEPIKVRMGLHTGEAIEEGEDFFGKSVILAARIASQAIGEQILVSSLLKALVESSGEFAFGEAQDVELKGLSGSHQVFDVDWQGA